MSLHAGMRCAGRGMHAAPRHSSEPVQMLRCVEQVGAPSGAPTCSTEHLNRAELDFRFGTGEPPRDRADYAAMSHDQGDCGTMRDYAGTVAR